MDKITTSKNSLILFIVSLCSAVISAALRCVDLFCFFDSDIGYFTSGAPLPIIADILLMCFALFFIVYSFVFIKKSKQSTDVSGKLSLKLGLGVIALILLSASLAHSYFNQTVQMNAPDKVLFGLACVFSMVYTANELKVAVGTTRRSTYCLFSALTILFGTTASIPSIIAYHAGIIHASYLSYAEYYLILAFAIYAAIRLLSTIRQDPESISEATEEEESVSDGETSAE